VRASADGKGATCLSSGEVVEQKQAAVRIPLQASPEPSGATAQSNSTSGTALPAERVRVSWGVSQSFLISKVPPIYPEVARRARVTGTVVLRALINQTGDVESLSLVSGHPLLAPAAMDAVKQWKYRPYLLNGKAVAVDTEIQVNFALSGQ